MYPIPQSDFINAGNKPRSRPVLNFNMSTQVLENRAFHSGRKTTGLLLLAGYVVVYAATLYAMVRFGQFEAGEALGVFAILGVGFSLAAWVLTIGVQPMFYRVMKPGSEVCNAPCVLATVDVIYRHSGSQRSTATSAESPPILSQYWLRSWRFSL